MRNTSILLLFLLTAPDKPVLAQSAGTFTATGNMSAPRIWHTATLLPDGRVLIAGGISSLWDAPLASAELYDPFTGRFTPTGNMTVARVRHTATLLASGKVLIAGGDDLNGIAELYDPKTGHFRTAGRMIPNGSRYYTATLLPDGRVLFVANDPQPTYPGSFDGSGAQIYDPSTDSFAATGSPLSAPYGPNTATSLPDGRVFITQSSEVDAEVYDPGTDSFHRSVQVFPPAVGAAALLLNGNVLLAGGNDFLGDSAVTFVYDTKTANRAPSGYLTQSRCDHTATVLPDGKVLIAGGQPLWLAAFSSAELYDQRSGLFTRTANMTRGRANQTATLLNNGTVLIAGGSSDDIRSIGVPFLDSAELYTPDSLIGPPVLFSISGDGTGPGAIWHSSSGGVVSASDPATPGEALSMYVSNLATGGVISPYVIVGGQFAHVLYFGPAPGYPSYYQLNFLMASGAHGSAVPISVRYLDRSSNEVTVSVQ